MKWAYLADEHTLILAHEAPWLFSPPLPGEIARMSQQYRRAYGAGLAIAEDRGMVWRVGDYLVGGTNELLFPAPPRLPKIV
jgi:hypothetical protein